jgi:SAM-dependent methyltransferase
MRNTDADWRAIGATEPFWGVVTYQQFKRRNLTSQRYAEFYASGAEHIKQVISRLEPFSGGPIRVARALDFGCGVGRLSKAMQEFADQVIGFDISPGMLSASTVSWRRSCFF